MALKKRAKAFLKNLGPRGFKARGLKKSRTADQKSFKKKRMIYYTDSNLTKYNYLFNAKIDRFLAARIKGKKKASAWDIGCGQGIFLKELKQKFGNTIFTAGTSLSRPPKKIKGKTIGTKGIDAFFVTRLSKPNKRFQAMKEKFDVIVCNAGEVQNMPIHEVLNKVLSRLKPGGRAYLDFGPWAQSVQKIIIEKIKEAGYKIIRTDVSLPQEAMLSTDKMLLLEIEKPKK